MQELRILNASEQVAEYLKDQLLRGELGRKMPGGARLARELGVGRMTVEVALSLLEKAGVLVPQGAGKRRKIDLGGLKEIPSLSVGILLYAPSDSMIHYNVELQNSLMRAGHSATFLPETLVDIKMKTSRLARLVNEHRAEAWIVASGSQGVLEWFASQDLPVFAVAGRRRGVGIAGTGPNKEDAMRRLVRRLVELGHRRIVLLAKEVRRKPIPGRFEQIFLDELSSHGIQHGPYNLPDWEETPEGLQTAVDSLFDHTPPTALIVEESHTMIAVQQHLANRGIVAPRDVTLVCDDPDPAFSWCRPGMAHISWDSSTIARDAVLWAANVARGREDRKNSFFKADLIEGGTMGPAPMRLE